MYINHITMSTGHIARTSRADVADDTLALLVPWLQSVVASGKIVPLPVEPLSHFGAMATVQDGALLCTIFSPAGPHKAGQPYTGESWPLVTLGVAQRSRHSNKLWPLMAAKFGARVIAPAPPWCAVAVLAPLAAYQSASEWLGDFERCIAWAWITRNPILETASTINDAPLHYCERCERHVVTIADSIDSVCSHCNLVL